MMEITGFLLDLFESPDGNISGWFIGDDGVRYRFRQHFPVTFYVSASKEDLQAVERRIRELKFDVHMEYTKRYEFFTRGYLPVLAVKVHNAYLQPVLFRRILTEFPELDYYDADVRLTLRHAATYQTFPLAYCRFTLDDGDWLRKIDVLDTPWEVDHLKPPLRILRLEPDVNPQQNTPKYLIISYDRHTIRLSFEPQRAMLINLKSIFEKYDPDIIQTRWGDTWLLSALAEAGQRLHIEVPWNREPGREFAHRPERSYFSYGHIIYRGQQVLLFGRVHIDINNAMFWKDYAMAGILEMARVTRLPIQSAARQSSGTGISSMQIIKALENNALVPYQKQQTEDPKSAGELLQFDQGGLVYQPIVGVHCNVGEIDFISMYPSIMVRCNISPETTPSYVLEPPDEPPGLIPQTLAPLLNKRIELKQRLGGMSEWVPEYEDYKQQSSAHKWLLVTCFGYLGYKNARFGRIEAHEAITANGREALLRAKETAEEMGFDILHLYVDGLWVQKKDASQPADFEALLDKIAEHTGLSVSLNGIYRWVAFLPSRVDERVPVPNRYFGVFQDGSIKIRGIEARRHDTPPFIANMQLELLDYLSKASSYEMLVSRFLPGALAILRRRMADLRNGNYEMEDLTVACHLSRELKDYRVFSASARAYKQLVETGRTLRPGQRVRFLYTRDKDGVYAWDQPDKPVKKQGDAARYRFLLLQAAETILKPFGWDHAMLETATGKIPVVQRDLFEPATKMLYPSANYFVKGVFTDLT